ncbi:MAG: hypothetical protein M3429_02950 [Verrucomicrobiota bacterium]|nr:hypothetical protein [Verrucomicrobiota bacterium]
MNDAFNYVAVLVSIVTGLAATNLMSGLSAMLQVANRPRVYWVHVLWIIIPLHGTHVLLVGPLSLAGGD